MKQSPFELFLDRLDPDWRGDQLTFFRVVAAAGPDMTEELSERVLRVSCPAGLKHLTLEFSYYFPWPEWCPVIDRLLRYEKRLDIFETGVRALGRIQTPEALEALRALSLSRATPGFREIVNEVLLESDPAEAFKHHFARLLQGSAQASDANEGALQLAKLLTPESLGPLMAGVSHPDPLIFRHSLRLMGQIQTREAATYLLDYLNDIIQEAQEDLEARAALANFRNLPRPEVQEAALQALSARWKEASPEAVDELTSGGTERVLAAITALRESGAGVLDTFLLDTLLATLDEKPAGLAKHLGLASDGFQQRLRRIDFGMDSAARSLAAMTGQGLIEPERVVPALAESLRRNTGNAGVARALAQLVPAEAQDLLDLLLEQAEGGLRGAALEALGERKEEALRPALLKVRRDAIADIADRSLWHLGQLPDPAGLARTLLDHSDPEEVLIGLRFARMHQLEELVPDILALAAREAREAILVAAFGTLGGIGSPRAVEPLLALLHSGQGPRLQIALAEALRDLGDAAGALGLCVKAKEMSAPGLHTLAVEALAVAHSAPDQPLPSRDSSALLQAVQGGWSDRNPWPFRCRIADALSAIQLQDPDVWVELLDLIQATLGEKRQPGSVSPEDLANVQSCARILDRKVHG